MGKIEFSDLQELLAYLRAFDYEEAIAVADRMGLDFTAAALREEFDTFRYARDQLALFREESQNVSQSE